MGPLGGLILAGPIGRFAHAVIYRSATILMPMLKKKFLRGWDNLAQAGPEVAQLG